MEEDTTDVGPLGPPMGVLSPRGLGVNYLVYMDPGAACEAVIVEEAISGVLLAFTGVSVPEEFEAGEVAAPTVTDTFAMVPKEELFGCGPDTGTGRLLEVNIADFMWTAEPPILAPREFIAVRCKPPTAHVIPPEVVCKGAVGGPVAVTIEWTDRARWPMWTVTNPVEIAVPRPVAVPATVTGESLHSDVPNFNSNLFAVVFLLFVSLHLSLLFCFLFFVFCVMCVGGDRGHHGYRWRLAVSTFYGGCLFYFYVLFARG